MILLNYIHNRCHTEEWKELQKTVKTQERVTESLRSLVIMLIIYFSSANVYAQKGPFIRFSLGPGYMKEYSTINESGFTIVTKNHAVGWGFSNKYGVSFSEFGAFIRKDIGEGYKYINLDAYGGGLSYRTKSNVNFHISGAYGTVHFSDSWRKQGVFIEDGYAVSFGMDKKWLLSKRIDLGAGPNMFYLKTDNYTFTNFSLNFWFDFYLFSQY
jgi:hypothetical protein